MVGRRTQCLMLFAWFMFCAVARAGAAKLPDRLQLARGSEPYIFQSDRQEITVATSRRQIKIPLRKCNAGQVKLFWSELQSARMRAMTVPIWLPHPAYLQLKEDGRDFSVLRTSRYGRYLRELPERMALLRLETKSKCGKISR